jgi:hypothetical protein
MKSLYLLLLLTQNGAGDINAAFVSGKSPEACEQSRQMVEAIFRSRAIPVLYQQCLPSNLRFSPFSHADSTRIERYSYLIIPPTNNNTLIIKNMRDIKSCLALSGQSKTTMSYCASSIQRPLD